MIAKPDLTCMSSWLHNSSLAEDIEFKFCPSLQKIQPTLPDKMIDIQSMISFYRLVSYSQLFSGHLVYKRQIFYHFLSPLWLALLTYKTTRSAIFPSSVSVSWLRNEKCQGCFQEILLKMPWFHEILCFIYLHYSTKLEEQIFGIRFFSLDRILDIFGVGRWNTCSCLVKSDVLWLVEVSPGNT